MALKELVAGLTEAGTVRRVFGDPIERDGALLIPVANVRGAFGGGEAPMPTETKPTETKPMGWGGGGGWSASPAGAYVLKDGTATWVPAVDANRTILLGILTGIVALLVLRSVIRSVVKRG
jgi:uncharacterized spore protein YtfJ